jgi:AraC-like DNA-binding protein
MLRPFLEHVPTAQDASWTMLNRRLDDAIPFEWHHHPEYELTLTLNSLGQRFIGDHVGAYGDTDLVLIGPNLPHTWSSQTKIHEREPHVALVFWFRQAWIDRIVGDLVELAPIRRMFASAASGIAFPPRVGRAMRERFESVFTLAPRQRLMAVLYILSDLAEEAGTRPLASMAPPPTPEGRSRIDRVLNHLHQAYAGEIRIEQLAEIAALSQSGLHRMFGKHTHTTISAYLAHLRIGDACARLAASDHPIAHIAAQAGYANLAHFNRQFRALRGMTPRQYRASFRR